MIAGFRRTAPVHILYLGEDFLQPEDPIPSFGGGGGPNRLPILIPELEDLVTAEERRESRELGCQVYLGMAADGSINRLDTFCWRLTHSACIV